MTEKTDSKEREDFKRWAEGQPWIKDCAPAAHGRTETFGHWDTEKAWLAFQAGRASLAASAVSEPVAYAMFADNGNIRLWSKARIPHPDAKPLYLQHSPPEGMVAEQALRKVLSVVQRYLPPDGPTAHDAMTEITEIVDPWPLCPLEKP